MEDQKRKAPLAVLGKYKYVLLVAALGAVLLLWPSGKKLAAAPAEEEPVRTGVDVMLTLQSGGEKVLAQDSSLRYSGNVQSPDSYERSTRPVTEEGGVVVTRETYPQYRGALVVCEGGGNDAVRLQVVSAVSALTGLGSDRIAVVKWQGASAAQE